MTDSATVCVKLVTPLDATVEFLTHLGDLFRNFGIHLRGETAVEVYLCRSANLSTVLQGSLKDVVSDVQIIDHEDWFTKSQMDQRAQ